MSKRGAMMAAVRQQGGGVSLFTPVGDSSVVAMYLANSNADFDLTGTTANEWKDSSGNGRHAPAAEVTNRATFTLGSQIVQNAAVTGKSGFLTPSITAGRCYVVIECGDGTATTWGSNQYIISGNYGAFGALRTYGNTSTLSSISSETTGYQAGGSTKNGDTTDTRYVLPMSMGLLVLTQGDTVRPATQINALMCSYTDDGRSLTHKVKGYIFTTGAESLAKKQKIEGWVMHNFGLQDQLVNGHLYKSEAPTI